MDHNIHFGLLSKTRLALVLVLVCLGVFFGLLPALSLPLLGSGLSLMV